MILKRVLTKKGRHESNREQNFNSEKRDGV